MEYKFTVKRTRQSATQGVATVYLNDTELVTFGDTIEIIKEGTPYYGENIGGWASTTPDGNFVYGVLFHEYDDIYHYSKKVREILKIRTEAKERPLTADKINTMFEAKEKAAQSKLSSHERAKNAVYATGNKWANENFHATHD